MPKGVTGRDDYIICKALARLIHEHSRDSLADVV